MSIQISIWDAKASTLVKTAVSGEDAVVTLANNLQKQRANQDSSLPGFELSNDNQKWGTLAVAVAPFGWALIHTSEDYTSQHCTYNRDNQSEETIDVHWDEVTSIPRTWFVPQDQAMDGIRQWLQDGTLSAAISWSDECD